MFLYITVSIYSIVVVLSKKLYAGYVNNGTFQEVIHLNLKIEPIGIIKNTASGLSDILIYSDYEPILGNVIEQFEKGTKVLIIHKNTESRDEHQVKVTLTELINRKGNLLTVKGIDVDNDSVIDVRMG